MMIFLIFLALLTPLLAFPLIYYLWMRNAAKKSWNLDIDTKYEPNVTLIIPAYNEATVIEKKLENTQQIDYPEDKLQVILVDSASNDGTLSVCRDFLKKKNFRFPIKLISERERKGKSHALNIALKYAEGEVIIISDADCFLSPKTVRNALPYLADKSVSAVTGREVIINPNHSWVTESETTYRNFVHMLRLGESKIYSTIFFEGGFGAYKKTKLTNFDSQTGADDSGTAFNLVQKGYKTLFIPEATFFTGFPDSWKGKVNIKIRRASQLVRIWSTCLSLLLKGKLLLPKRIAVPEIIFFVLNPLIFLMTAILAPIFVITYPISLVLLIALILIPKSRRLFFENVQSNCILLGGIINLLFHKEFVVWNKVEESRSSLDIALPEESRFEEQTLS